MQLNEGLETLGYSAFEYSAIESIRFPSTLKRIENGMFENCENLKSVEIPEGVDYIGYRCFESSAI